MKWLFILGCNNSGTTLLNDLLADHPEIDGMDCEGQAMKAIRSDGTDFPTPYPEGYILPPPRLFVNVDGEPILRVWTERLAVFRHPIVNLPLLKRHILSHRTSVGGTYTMEKSPTSSVRSLWLQEHFKDAYFIAITRNGYAVCEGIRRRYNLWMYKVCHSLAEEHGTADRFRGRTILAPYQKDGGRRGRDLLPLGTQEMTLRRASKHWVKVHEVMLEDAEELENFTLIQYEDLCESPEYTLDYLSSRLGLEAHDYEQVLRQQEIQNMNHLSFENLSSQGVATITRYAGEMLPRLGYPVSLI